MDVDKSRCDNMARGVDGLLAGDLFLCDEGDGAVFDADVAHGIELGLRVHDPTVVDNKIILCGRRGYPRHQGQKHKCRSNNGFFHNFHISWFLMVADQCTTGHTATTRLPALRLSSAANGSMTQDSVSEKNTTAHGYPNVHPVRPFGWAASRARRLRNPSGRHKKSLPNSRP